MEIIDKSQRYSRERETSPVAKVVLVILGGLFLISGLSGIIAGVSVAITPAFIFDLSSMFTERLADFGLTFLSQSQIGWFCSLLGCVVIIPFIAMVYFGLMIIIGFKAPKWKPGLIMLLVWFLCLMAFVVYSIVLAMKWFTLNGTLVF